MLFLISVIFFMMHAMAQWPGNLRSTGNSISESVIADWMNAAGEITTVERNAALSISFLNGKSHLSDKTVPFSLSDWYGYGIVCGNSFTIKHTAGINGAPVTKTITYGTVMTTLSGANKCWITQNLGASQKATSEGDVSDASAGWYYQFNRVQGYDWNSTTNICTPTSYETSISENSNWIVSRDPCTLLLGNGWRLPTYTEWMTFGDALGGARTTGTLQPWELIAWTNGSAAYYGSVLKLHMPGFLSPNTRIQQGTTGCYWSSTQYTTTGGYSFAFYVQEGDINIDRKELSRSVRCIRD